MPPKDEQCAAQEKLKAILQQEVHEKTFERLVAALLSRLLGVEIAVARSGFQFGGDGGPSGRQGRHFRMEAKRYSDATPPSLRELTGEIVQALKQDPALEGWFLAATREVPEQVESSLHFFGDEQGVPVVVIDCKKGSEIWSLTALCTADPSVLDSTVSPEAGEIARSLVDAAADALERLRRDCQSWQLGFDSLRVRSHAELGRIWSSPSAAIARLGQDAAIGSHAHRVRRNRVAAQLDQWWVGAVTDEPVAVVGLDGVGKTWAVVDWLAERREQQPIVLMIPASFVASVRSGGSAPLRVLLAEHLYSLTQVRSVAFWEARLMRLLKRPTDEGPALTLLVDGLNQVSDIAWLDLFRGLQDQPFLSRVRLMVTTRTYHFEDRLRRLTGLAKPPLRVDVSLYDDDELNAMLAFEDLTQDDLHPELIPLACRPRLFALVVKFRHRLVEAGSITPHRLLWEYGKDTLGPQPLRSFSEWDWREWLQVLANRTLANMRTFSSQALSESAARPDLTPSEVFSRLSDLIDGSFVDRTSRGFEPTAAIVAHALGLALLIHLDEIKSIGEVEAALNRWLDAIAGLDERAEILRAAASIMVARDLEPPAYASTILLAWLQSQNLPEGHMADLNGLAQSLVVPLLEAIEASNQVQRSARLYAVNAIRSLPRDDAALQAMIFDTTSRWLRVVPLDAVPNASEEAERSRSDRLRRRVGRDSSGEIVILGTPILLVDRRSSYCTETIASLLDGFPLARGIRVFETAAIAAAIDSPDELWNALKWLVLLNAVDRDETTEALRERSRQTYVTTPEAGVHPDLIKRIAALLLWMTSEDDDGHDASSIDTPSYPKWNYETDYLGDPGRSFFSLERRHATEVLADQELPLHSRLSRGKRLILDPTFVVPAALTDEVIAMTNEFPVGDLDSAISPTDIDVRFEQAEVLLARTAQKTLGSLVRAKLSGLGSRPPESRYWVAVRIREHAIVWDKAAVEPARCLRELPHDTTGYEEVHAASNLVMIEVLDLPPVEQVRQILGALLGDNMDFAEVVGILMPDEIAGMIAEHGDGDGDGDMLAISNLSTIILLTSISLDDASWSWMLNLAFSGTKEEQRSVAFQTLWRSNAGRFGKELIARDWAWQPAGPHHVNHFGSLALSEAAEAMPFDQIMPKLAPWLLLPIARRRGEGTTETMLAAQLLDKVLRPTSLSIEDLPTEIVVHLDKREANPFAFSLVVPPIPDREDPVQNWRGLMDTQARETSRRDAFDTALARIAEARKAGADLLLSTFDPEDLRPIFKIAPTLVEAWAEGADRLSSDFKRRIKLSYGFHLALCEAALEELPELGATLWRALRAVGGRQVLGMCRIDETIHIPFRVGRTSQSDALLAELLDPSSANTDMHLLEIAVAADANGRNDWLDDVIAGDAGASETWRRRRAEVLIGFRSNTILPVEDAWPEGQLNGLAFRRNRAAKWQSANACASHWWSAYVNAADADEALGCWVLLLQCADRRALLRIRDEMAVLDDATRLGRMKRIHAVFNMPALIRSIEKREKDLCDTFLGERTVRGIWPWL